MIETRLAAGLATLVITSLLSSCGRQGNPVSEDYSQTDETLVVKSIQDNSSSQPIVRIHFSDAAVELAQNTKVCATSCSSLEQLSVAAIQDRGVVQLPPREYTALELSVNGKLYALQLNSENKKTSDRREILVDVVDGILTSFSFRKARPARLPPSR